MEKMEKQDNRIRIEKSDLGNFFTVEILIQSTPLGDTWGFLGFFSEEDRAFKSALEALDG